MRTINSNKNYFILLLLGSFLYPVFAPNYTFNISQPNGYTFEVKMYGSEHYNYMQTIDGYTVSSVNIGRELWWYYSKKENGKVLASDILVLSNNNPPDYSFNLKPDYVYKNILHGHRNNEYRSSYNISEISKIKPLVILVDFSDNFPVNNHKYSKEQFSAIMFQENLSPSSFDIPLSYSMSVKDYFHEASDGKIIIEGNSNSVVDWVTLPESYSYYVNENQGLGMGDGNPKQSAKEALIHAMELIDVDMTQFDGDNDGVCDGIIMIMEGSDSGSLNEFWSFKSSLWYGDALDVNPLSPVNGNDELVYDGIVIRNFIVTTETIYHSDSENYSSGDIRPIGTICHEIGHLLGLPDLYDTSESSAPGIGDWGLMGSGNWNNQVSPSLFCSWSASKLGVVELYTLDNVESYNINIQPIHASNMAYKINIGGDRLGEYIILENRLGIGTDSYLKANGLLIWHIDERLTSTFPFYNEVNTNENFYGVRLLEAGGSNDLSTANSSIYSSEDHVFNISTSIINDYTNPSLLGNSYDKDADGNREEGTLSGIEIRNIFMNGDNVNLSITAPAIKGDRLVYNESGVQGCVNPDLLDYSPGVKYSTNQNDEYLKAVQVPIINQNGSVDALRLSVYNITENPSFIDENNILYSIYKNISWGCDRTNGIIDILLDNVYLERDSKYFIQFDYYGSGYITPIEFPFFTNISSSGMSYKKNGDGSLTQISNADFAITIITSDNPNHEINVEEADICERLKPKFPFPNPSIGQITIPYSDAFLGDADILVYDIRGRLRIKKNLNLSNYLEGYHLGVNSLSSGIYFIIVSNKNGENEKYKISIIH